MQRKKACPLYPESGHVRCNCPCPLSANSGHHPEYDFPSVARRQKSAALIIGVTNSAASLLGGLLAVLRGHCLFNLLFHCCEIEAPAFLHRREFNRSLGEFGDFLLHEDEPPELEGPPVFREQRLVESRALEGVEPDVDEDGKIDLDGIAEPTGRLISEPIFVIADAKGRSVVSVKYQISLRFDGPLPLMRSVWS